jgi:hypothetical protein
MRKKARSRRRQWVATSWQLVAGNSFAVFGRDFLRAARSFEQGRNRQATSASKALVALEDLLVLRLFQVCNEFSLAARLLPVTDWLTEAIWESN